MSSAIYHGFDKEPPFFQSWYFKLVSADQKQCFAILPGVMLGEEPHTFVQVLNGATGRAVYFEYPIQAFRPEANKFAFSINKKNQFSAERVAFDIAMEHGGVKGHLHFSNLLTGLVTNSADFSRGIPSLSQQLNGILTIDSQPIDFTGGHGTIQTFWGKTYPEASLWLQTNHLDSPAVCLTVSMDLLPPSASPGPGFVAAFRLGEVLYLFSPETGAKLKKLEISAEKVFLSISDAQHILEMTAIRAEGGLLRAPTTIDMSRQVEHTLNSSLQMCLSTHGGEKIFAGAGRCVSLELSQPEKLLKKVK